METEGVGPTITSMLCSLHSLNEACNHCIICWTIHYIVSSVSFVGLVYSGCCKDITNKTVTTVRQVHWEFAHLIHLLTLRPAGNVKTSLITVLTSVSCICCCYSIVLHCKDWFPLSLLRVYVTYWEITEDKITPLLWTIGVNNVFFQCIKGDFQVTAQTWKPERGHCVSNFACCRAESPPATPTLSVIPPQSLCPAAIPSAASKVCMWPPRTGRPMNSLWRERL